LSDFEYSRNTVPKLDRSVLSRHNHSKHWVDDVDNRRHDPIGLEQVWHTKW
jgi:hypothetical protein